MKHTPLLTIVLLSVTLPSCSIIGGIFKTGLSVGFFIAIAIVITIVAVAISALRNKK